MAQFDSYEKLTIDAIAAQVVDLQDSIDLVDAAVAGIDTAVEGIDTAVGGIDASIVILDTAIDTLKDTDVSNLDAKVDLVQAAIDTLDSEFPVVLPSTTSQEVDVTDDTDLIFSGGTSGGFIYSDDKFICQQSGVFVITFKWRLQNIDGNSGILRYSRGIKKNGEVLSEDADYTNSASIADNAWLTITQDITIALKKGDYISMGIYNHTSIDFAAYVGDLIYKSETADAITYIEG